MTPDERDHDGWRVARPRIVGARRSVPGRFTVGDECIAEFSPGLLRLLSLSDASRQVVGSGAALPWSIPVGAAGTAAYGVLEPPGFACQNWWTGITNVIHWTRAVEPGELLLAHCRLAYLGKTSARLPYRVVSGRRRDLIVAGEFVFVSVINDRPHPYQIEPGVLSAPVAATSSPRSDDNTTAMLGGTLEPSAAAVMPMSIPAESTSQRSPFEAPNLDAIWTPDAPGHADPPEASAPDLFALRPPQVEARSGDSTGDVWRWHFPNDLFRLLAHPVAGHSEPLGRRFHPYGRILEGMGLHATLVMAGRGVPRQASVRWRAPVRGNADFQLTSTIEQCTPIEFSATHLIHEGDREVGVVNVCVAR